MTPRAEWRSRTAFAEVAETIGVPTDSILASWSPGDGTIGVLYSPERGDATRVFQVTLTRGTDGVLRQASASEEVPGLWDEIVRRMDAE